MRWVMGRGAKLAIGVVLALLAGPVLLGPFSSLSVCSRCGRERRRVELQLPLLPLPYFWWTTERDSPLSSTLAHRGLRRGHEHQWLLGIGSGNGVQCALGHGRHLLPATQSPSVSALVDDLAAFATPQEAETWLGLLLGPKATHLAGALADSYPAAGFDRREAFEAWRRGEGAALRQAYADIAAR